MVVRDLWHACLIHVRECRQGDGLFLREEQVVPKDVDVSGCTRLCMKCLCLAGCLCRGDVQHRTDHVAFDMKYRVPIPYSAVGYIAIGIPVTLLSVVQNIPRLQELLYVE